MSIDLLGLAKEALGGQLGQLAGALGEPEEKTKSAVEVAAPALLGLLIKKASTPQGAEEVFSEANQFDTGILDNLGSLLGGQAQQADTGGGLLSMGAKLLPALLGGKEDSLISMIAKMAGIGQGSSKSLLSMLAPIIFGMIAKQVKSGNLDLKGLINLLMGQKKHVAKSLPGSFAEDLGISTLLDQGTAAAKEVGRDATAAARETANQGGDLMKMLIPLLLVLALGFLAYKMLFSGAAEKAAETAGEVAGDVADAAGEVAGEVADVAGDAAAAVGNALDGAPSMDFDAISKELGITFSTLTSSISDITDEQTAQAAVPHIDALTTQLDNLGYDKMAAPQKKTLAGVLGPLVEKLKAAIETAYNLPGVKAILGSKMESLLKTLTAMLKP